MTLVLIFAYKIFINSDHNQLSPIEIIKENDSANNQKMRPVFPIYYPFIPSTLDINIISSYVKALHVPIG